MARTWKKWRNLGSFPSGSVTRCICDITYRCVPVDVRVFKPITKHLQFAKSPLVLKGQGSFVIGGENIQAQAGDLGQGAAPGHFTIKQMYVEYMIPQGATKVPVVMRMKGDAARGDLQDHAAGKLRLGHQGGDPLHRPEQCPRATRDQICSSNAQCPIGPQVSTCGSSGVCSCPDAGSLGEPKSTHRSSST